MFKNVFPTDSLRLLHTDDELQPSPERPAVAYWSHECDQHPASAALSPPDRVRLHLLPLHGKSSYGPCESHQWVYLHLFSLFYLCVILHLLSCNHNPPTLLPLHSAAPSLIIPPCPSSPLQLWAMHVPLCPSWWQVWRSCRGRPTRWWSRRCPGRSCRCRPCRISSWLPSTSCLGWQRLSSPLHVSERLEFGLEAFVNLLRFRHDSRVQGRCWHVTNMKWSCCCHFLPGRFPHIFPTDPEPHQRHLPALPHSVLRRGLFSWSLYRPAGLLSLRRYNKWQGEGIWLESWCWYGHDCIWRQVTSTQTYCMMGIWRGTSSSWPHWWLLIPLSFGEYLTGTVLFPTIFSIWWLPVRLQVFY